jgi:agmatinase
MDNSDLEIENSAGSYDNFLSVPPEFSEKDAPAFRVFTAPFERTTSYRRGAARGPRELILASAQVETFDFEIGMRAYELGITTDRSLERFCGGEYTEFHEAARAAIGGSIGRGEVPVTIGGEHTVSLAGAAASLEKFPDLTVVQIDAHTDLRDSYEGDPHSHASVMRRMLELGAEFPRLVQIGMRSVSEQEARFAESHERTVVFPARRILAGEVLYGDIIRRARGNVYLTVDLDGFDPSEVPGVGTPEPGGLSWWWTVELIERLCGAAKVVAFDIVELCPIVGENRSEFLAAKLAYRIMGLIAKSCGRGPVAGR